MLHSGHDFAQGNISHGATVKGGGRHCKSLKIYQVTFSMASVHLATEQRHVWIFNPAPQRGDGQLFQFLNMTWSVLFSLNTARMLS